ncbi:MAG: ubiquitin-specific protease doa4 [Bogoriella megaspora]|nr:MAG: ubiquitin-specific protease doa4 [Bogoriella megaspora]
MSAAAPLPPPSPPRSSRDSSSYGGRRGQNGMDEPSRNWPGANGRGAPSSRRGPMPHILDLQAEAAQAVNVYSPISILLDIAASAAKTAETNLEFRRPDRAYVDYLTASDIVMNIIPQHKDAPALHGDRGRLFLLNKHLMKQLDAQHAKFADIKEIIREDNYRSGIRPSSNRTRDYDSTYRPSSRGSTQSVQSRPPERGGYLSMPDGPGYENGYSHSRAGQRSSVGSASDLSSGRSTPTYSSTSSKPRPPIHSKPDGIHGRALPYSDTAPNNYAKPLPGDALSERFARLRTSGNSVDAIPSSLRPGTSSSQRSSTPESPKSISSPSDYDTVASSGYPREGPTSAYTSPSKRPYGPRGMPPVPPGPPHPPKLPLDTRLPAAMPKEPSPTYSPARNMPTPASINPPRSTARSMVSSGRRTNSILSPESTRHPSIDEGSAASYFPSPTNGVSSSQRNRGGSINLAGETTISADKLYDFKRLYQVLLIDVRPRSEFDEGHIWSQSIMCIEPTGLRPDMSAEDIEDSIIISPDNEQEMFAQRDQFDLVVYYDQSSASDEYLRSGGETDADMALKWLHQALVDFNQEKPLQWPPKLLVGGIEAWIDLSGEQALRSSDSAARVRSKKADKSGRPISRVPIARETSVLVQKRRLRDYNPLNEDEERKWEETARIESVSVDQMPALDEDDEQSQIENATPIVKSYEDYLRRFPEVSALEKQSMTTPLPPARSPPPIPTYHPPPVPQAPSRPAPAAPRVSYSGVHDRNLSSNAPVSRSEHLPTYIPPQYLPQNLRLPRTGIINFGVTCYMNATIQCLSATTPLALFFRDEGWRRFLQKDNWKGSRGLMPEFFGNVIKSLWKGDVGAIRPSSLRGFCARLNQEWGIDRQQDAKEFFDFLVDVLHEDLNTNWSKPPLRSLTLEEEATREKMARYGVAKTEWGRYIHREQSYLTNLFAGQHASRLRCMTCNFTSTTYEAFYSISVEIPRSHSGDIRDCLRHYCAEERLSGDEVWKCPRCNKEREATKQITITRAPQFLVIHFKRFSASRTESARKVRTPVDFPLHGLDLEPYMLPSPTAEEAEKISRTFCPEYARPDPAMSPPQVYDAYAVMRHIGTTMTSGHYVAMVKDSARGCWWQYNDTRVDDFEPRKLREGARLQNEQAYIVFYHRVSVPGSKR